MSCHRTSGAKRFLHITRHLDDSLPDSDSRFWHKVLGSKGPSSKTYAEPEEAVKVIQKARIAAMEKKGSKYSDMTLEERLEASSLFQDFIGEVESGEIRFTENQLLKIASYTSKSKSQPLVARVGAGAGALLIGSGFAATTSAAAANINVQRTRGGVEYIWATKKNADLLHTRAKRPLSVDGSCPEDFSLARAKGTHKVSWKWPKGREGIKKIKKKKWVCIYTAEDGTQTEGAISDGGRLEELPKGFPAYGKANGNDVKKLNLGNDVRVSRWNPDGTQNMAAERLYYAVQKTDWSTQPLKAKAELPDTIRYTAGRGVVTGSDGVQYVITEYTIKGGSGYYSEKGPMYDPATGDVHAGAVKLNPKGTSTLYMATRVESINNSLENDGRYPFLDFPRGRVYADRGQGALGAPELVDLANNTMVPDKDPVNNPNGQGKYGPQFDHQSKEFAANVADKANPEYAPISQKVRRRPSPDGTGYFTTPGTVVNSYAGPPPGYTPPSS
jgi:hypothetical protein